ncbi:SCL-interrupting locus protein [Pelodytes ibericus]
MTAKMSLKNVQCLKEGKGLSTENQLNLRNMANRLLPLSFPPSKVALWDPTPVGDPIGLHVSHYRNPRLVLSEKALRLTCRHAKSERRLFSCFLLGSLSVDEDEEGITLTVDRFDPGREKTLRGDRLPSALLPGDFVIPCSVVSREYTGPFPVHTSEDFKSSFKGLQHHLHSKEALDLSKLLTVRAHITYTEDMDNLHFDLHWAAITVANIFEITPVKPVPIIPTALARNLSSHNNIAQLQGTHKCGYLTMDQTRKLLLVLESDPKVYTLPLVGIWLSGVTHIHSPQVWSSCLRYMFSSSIKERVLLESGSFLIVLYSRTHKEPEFYECIPYDGHDPLRLQLLTSEDTLRLFRNVEAARKTHHQFEFSTEGQISDTFLFKEASNSISTIVFKKTSSPSKLSVSDHDSGVEDEDFSPRPSPRPHPSVQQVTRIHPSVPELSLVFGSLIESKSTLPNSEDGRRKVTSTPEGEHKQFAGIRNKPSENHAQDPYTTSTPASIDSKAPTKKRAKGKLSPADAQATHLNSNNQIRRNSTSSSSSSLSAPRSGSSPDASVHQSKPEANCNMKAPHHWQPPLTRSTSHCRQTSAPQSPTYNDVTFPLVSRQSAETPKPLAKLQPLYNATGCNCCHNRGPMQCLASPWSAMSHMSHHTMENRSEPPGSVTPPYPNMACPSLCCSPVCINNCTKSSVKIGCSSPMENVILSPSRRESLTVNPCSPHSCQYTPPPMMPSENGMLGLSAEAYKLLAEQDKQLKLLQAQIQRLLEAQTQAVDLSKPSFSDGSTQVQTESDSTEMSGLEKKTSVSIAVSTGASLFWNSPHPEEEGSVDQQDDSDLCKELSAAVNNEQDTSRTSIASSLKAVDIYSFAESSQLTDRGSSSSSIPMHSSLNQSCFPPLPPDHLGNVRAEELGQCVPSVSTEKFYQDLMCQVNNMLKTPKTAEETQVSSSYPSRTCDPPERKKKFPSSNSRENKDDVLKATLKQLKNFGVNIEPDTSERKTKNSVTADNACVLACINPEAIIPRLNYVSFTNIGLSGFIPNGVDLSMEANAIALKYLSESQLTQLSLSHTNKSKPLDSSTIASLFPGNTDKSMVGFSLISPNNMSFATKKYMKRYALIDSNDSSDDEADLTTDNCCVSEDGPTYPNHSSITESFERIRDGTILGRENSDEAVDSGFINYQEASKLRNITNEVPAICGTAPRRSDHMSPPFLKDFKTKSKVSGKAQSTRHPEKENAGTLLFFTEKAAPVKPIPECQSIHGDILDVNRLRQLPKLF